MKKINKVVIAGLSLALLVNASVFAETERINLLENNQIVNEDRELVSESMETRSLDYRNLPQGEYNIKMTVMNAKKKKAHLPSMMNDAVADKKIVVDSDGQYWLHLTMKKIKYTTILNGKEFTKEGYMNNLKYYKNINDKTAVDAVVLSTQEDFEDLNYPESSKKIEYPKEVKFPIDKPNEKIQKVKIQVFVKVMEDLKNGMGTQNAMPTIDWSDFSER